MSVDDWVQLIAQQYLTITWNYASGTVLQPGTSQTVTITINVNQQVTSINTFTNNIYIIATNPVRKTFCGYDAGFLIFALKVYFLETGVFVASDCKLGT